jgi:hypothetical protein
LECPRVGKSVLSTLVAWCRWQAPAHRIGHAVGRDARPWQCAAMWRAPLALTPHSESLPGARPGPGGTSRIARDLGGCWAEPAKPISSSHDCGERPDPQSGCSDGNAGGRFIGTVLWPRRRYRLASRTHRFHQSAWVAVVASDFATATSRSAWAWAVRSRSLGKLTQVDSVYARARPMAACGADRALTALADPF